MDRGYWSVQSWIVSVVSLSRIKLLGFDFK
jgi:hypothetical protein